MQLSIVKKFEEMPDRWGLPNSLNLIRGKLAKNSYMVAQLRLAYPVARLSVYPFSMGKRSLHNKSESAAFKTPQTSCNT